MGGRSAIRLGLTLKLANLLARFIMGECKRPKMWPKAYQLKVDPVAWNSTIGAIKQLSTVPTHPSTGLKF